MFIEDDDKTSTHQQPDNANVNVGSGAGAGAFASGPTSAPSSSTPEAAPKAQSFASVQDYLKNNQNQAEDLGGKVTGQLQSDYDTSKGTIDSAASGAANDINSGTTAFDQGLVNEASSNPTAVANDPNKSAAFAKQWNASYTGPSSFEASNEYNDALGAKTTADTRAAELGSEGGREQLIGDQFGVYGQGNKGLDAALLQTSSAEPTLQGYVPQFKSVSDYLNSKASDLDTQATNAQTATNNAQAQTRAAFANKLGDFQTDLNNRVDAARTAANSGVSAIQQDLASGDVGRITADLTKSGATPDQIKSVGDYLKALQGDYSTSPDLSQFNASNPEVDVNAGNVATAQDYANAAALQQLTGVDYSGVLNPANASQAGTAPSPTLPAQNISDYLKQQVATDDQKTLADTRPIGQVLSDPNNASDAARIARSLVDATTRSGSKPTMSSVLGPNAPASRIKDLYQQAAQQRLSGNNSPAINAFMTTLGQLLS